jgi:hypothetical protein
MDTEPTVRRGSQTEVLDSPELLGRIFANFNPKSDQPLLHHVPSQPLQQHLLWAALTCKTFLEPALDVLWRSMNSLIPLLKLLPSFQLVLDTYVTNVLLLRYELKC